MFFVLYAPPTLSVAGVILVSSLIYSHPLLLSSVLSCGFRPPRCCSPEQFAFFNHLRSRLFHPLDTASLFIFTCIGHPIEDRCQDSTSRPQARTLLEIARDAIVGHGCLRGCTHSRRCGRGLKNLGDILPIPHDWDMPTSVVHCPGDGPIFSTHDTLRGCRFSSSFACGSVGGAFLF